MTYENKPVELTDVSISIENKYVVLYRAVGRNQYRFGILKDHFSDADYGAMMKTRTSGFDNNVKVFEKDGDDVISINDVYVDLSVERSYSPNLRKWIRHMKNDPCIGGSQSSYEQDAESRGSA